MKNKQNEVSQDGWKGEQNSTAQRLSRKHKKHTEDNKAHIKHRHSEGDGYTLKRSKWRVGTLVNAMRVAKIRSNLHIGQYAGGVPSDHGQRQALVEPLSLPGVAWNVNEFLCETAQSGNLACHWLIMRRKKYFTLNTFKRNVSNRVSNWLSSKNHWWRSPMSVLCPM